MERHKSKAEQLESIKRGRGIQHILDEIYKIIGNPVLIHDMEYNLVAFSKTDFHDDPIWNEYIVHGRLSDETLELIKDEGFIDTVANSTVQDGVVYLISDQLKYNRIFGQLYNKNQIPVADLIVMECEAPFDDDTVYLVKTICNILSKALGKSDYYQDYGQAYQENIVRKLIEGSIDDKAIYAGHVANIDRGQKTYIFVAVLDLAQCDPECARLVYYRDFIQRKQPAFKCYIYSNRIVVIISSGDESLHGSKELGKLSRLFEQENIYAGVSSGFENLFEMASYYNEALEALDLGLKGDCTERIFLHDNTK